MEAIAKDIFERLSNGETVPSNDPQAIAGGIPAEILKII